MILVDTSVWIDHLRDPNPELVACLNEGTVFSHEMVIGELACGNLGDRSQFLDHLNTLPTIKTLPIAEVLSVIETRRLMGKGIGYVDANLLGSVLAHGDASLWTADKRLREIADEFGVAHTGTGGP